MSALAISHLISKIKEDTALEAKAISEKASKEEKEILQKRVGQDAKQEHDIILEKAQREAISKAERILSSVELKVRNDKLQAKQVMIDKVFDTVLTRLDHLSSEELVAFIKKAITEASFEGEAELIISKEYKAKLAQDFITDMNVELAELGRNAIVKLSTQERKLNNEFVLSQNGIELNFSFNAIIASLKDEMEYEITKILFQ